MAIPPGGFPFSSASVVSASAWKEGEVHPTAQPAVKAMRRLDPILATTARMEDLGINGGEGDEAPAAVAAPIVCSMPAVAVTHHGVTPCHLNMTIEIGRAHV